MGRATQVRRSLEAVAWTVVAWVVLAAWMAYEWWGDRHEKRKSVGLR